MDKRLTSSSRIVPLEACRGIAAIIVMLHHAILGFMPSITGILPNSAASFSMAGHWYYFIVNGGGAVDFFFTLSGFVLYWSVRTNKSDGYNVIAILKRYPRLAFPVIISTVLSWLLFKLNAYYFVEASKISGSPWLATFASADWTPNFQVSLLRAIREGAETFFTGSRYYNSNLWTMKPEFIGSIFVFMLAPSVKKSNGALIIFFLFVIALAYSIITYKYLLGFCVGMFLSEVIYRAMSGCFEVPSWISVILVLLGFYSLGYIGPYGDYGWLGGLTVLGTYGLDDLSVVHTLGSSLIIASIMMNERAYNWLSGYIFNFIGRVSFPLYLVHILAISSISSLVYICVFEFTADMPIAFLSATTTTIASSFLMAFWLAQLDELWVKWLNNSIRRCNESATAVKE